MGIVVHTGEIDGGHYYSFIRERNPSSRNTCECKWWKFDDSNVEEWDISRLKEDCFGGYMDIDLPHDRESHSKITK